MSGSPFCNQCDVTPPWAPFSRPTPITLTWRAGENPNNRPIFIAKVPMQITQIIGRLETAEGAAATIQPVKAANSIAISVGTNLTSTTFNANGTAATNQLLALSVAPADLQLAAGDAIGLKTTGAWTTSVGCLTFSLVPISC